MDWATQIKAGDLVAEKRAVVEVSTHTTVAEVARLLKSNNFQSVPVYDEEQKKYIGFVDVLDLLAHTQLMMDYMTHRTERLEDFEASAFAFGTAVDIMKEEKRRKIHLFGPETRLENVLRIFSKDEPRVLVTVFVKVNLWWSVVKGGVWKKREYRMLTQTDVVRYIAMHQADMGNRLNVRVGDLRGTMDKKRVATLGHRKRAIDGFSEMLNHKVDALVIVDEHGVGVGVLSAADLRGIGQATLKNLLIPVLDYIAVMTGRKPRDPVTCKPDDLLPGVIDKLINNKVHRTFMINENGTPIGSVTMRDVIRHCLDINYDG